MSFFENLSKRVGEVAQSAAKKSSELVEITKLNVSIGSEEEKIQKLYAKMGKKIYEIFSSGSEVEDIFEEDCEAIKKHQQNIEILKQKIREIKNVKVCPNCGIEINKISVFCSKCGTKLKQEETDSQSTPSDKHCPSCNAKLPEDAEFCTNCGAKVE